MVFESDYDDREEGIYATSWYQFRIVEAAREELIRSASSRTVVLLVGQFCRLYRLVLCGDVRRRCG